MEDIEIKDRTTIGRNNEEIRHQQQQALRRSAYSTFPDRKKGKERKKAINLNRYLDSLAHTRQLNPVIRNKIKYLTAKKEKQVLNQLLLITHRQLIRSGQLTSYQRRKHANKRIWTLNRNLYLLPAGVVKPQPK